MRAAKKTTPRERRQRAQAVVDAPTDVIDLQTDSLGYTLRRAQMRAYDLFFEMLNAYELTPARLTALSTIAMEPNINQSALAQRLDITGPSVLKMVDALEAAGYVSREDCADDRRRYALALTPAGRTKLEEAHAATRAFEVKLAANLSINERRQLMKLLDKVAIADRADDTPR